MITCQMVPLPQVREDALKTMLRSNACDTLRDVAEAQVKRLQAMGLQEALKVDPGNEKQVAMSARLFEAQIYQHFLDVLDEFQKLEKFELAKLT